MNDYFGQTANIAARVQSAAKGSECFVTETVLDSENAREAYAEITGPGSSFQATPLTELKLKGVNGKVHARGFRWLLRSRSESTSELSGSGTSLESNYMERKVNRTYSSRLSINSMGEDDDETDVPRTKQFDRPGEMGQRDSKLGAHSE